METKIGDLECLAQTSAKTLQKDSEGENAKKEEVPEKLNDPASGGEASELHNAPVAEISPSIPQSKPAVEETKSKSQDAPPPEEVPDPDEDDLDDLDGKLPFLAHHQQLTSPDMLDEFTPSKPTPPSTSGPGRPPPLPTAIPEAVLPAGVTDDEFAAQLQAGMAEMMSELETNPDMAVQLENMLKELGAAGALGEAAGIPPPVPSAKETATKTAPRAAAASSATEESFQETIKKTMERMRESDSGASAAAASSSEEDILAEMMKAMSSGGLDGEGNEEDFSKMLLGMMEQLTNKEILYEPMKELDDKFPAWMEKNAGKTPEDDLRRYKEQQVYVREIVGRFEAKGYSDENAADREFIVERMQKVRRPCSFNVVLFKSVNLYFNFVLTRSRCKQRALRQLIWLVIWQQLKKHLVQLILDQKKGVLNNEEAFHINANII